MVKELATLVAARYCGQGDCVKTVSCWSHVDPSISQAVVVFEVSTSGFAVVYGSESTCSNWTSYQCDTLEQAAAYISHLSCSELCADAAHDMSPSGIEIDIDAVRALRKSWNAE